MIMTAIITVIAAYLLGSISFAVIFTKAFSNKDIREFGSKNAGATNATRVGGAKAGALTFLCDLLKGVLAVFLGHLIFGYIFEKTGAVWALPTYGEYLCGTACFFGHIFPVFFGFRGGKGVATGAGIFLAICPIAGACGLAAFGILFLLTRYVSVGSLAGTLVTVVTALILHDSSAAFLPQLILGTLMGGTIFWKHSENIKRLLAGEEKKMRFGGKKNG